MSSVPGELRPAAEMLTIGEVARRAGKQASSIRYYESIGLMPKPERVNGRRRYPTEILRTLAVIDTAQRASMSLGDIKLLLDATPDDASAVERLRDLAQRKLPDIQALAEQTRIVQQWLESAARCKCPTLADCPLFDDQPTLPAPKKSPQRKASRHQPSNRTSA